MKNNFIYNLRSLGEHAENEFPRIEIAADSMRVGKTTVVTALSEGLAKSGLRIQTNYEDWQHNPYLQNSYKHPKKAFLLSQKWFIQRKFEQVSETPKNRVVIQDLSPEGDYNYAYTNCKIGRMSKVGFKNYKKYYLSLPWGKVRAPDLLVYLMADDEILIARAKAAAREFEVVDGDYFLALKQTNREWLNQIENKWSVLVINTNHFDYAHDQVEKKHLVKMIINELVKLGWKKVCMTKKK